MAHPFQQYRADKVEHERVGKLTKGYARGGAVKHVDEAADRKLIKSMMATEERKEEGAKPKARLDRHGRGRGGKVKSGKTNINVIVAPQGGDRSPLLPPVGPGAGAMPPAPPPRPPMLPPGMPPAGAGMAPGMPPGIPGGIGAPGMIRRTGGRAYAKGGRVTSGPAWEEGRRAGTQVSHSPGKNDGKFISDKPALLTRRSGGRIEAGKEMGPPMRGGAESGEGRLDKIGIQKRSRRP